MLTAFDPDLVGWLMDTFHELGIDVRTRATVASVHKTAAGVVNASMDGQLESGGRSRRARRRSQTRPESLPPWVRLRLRQRTLRQQAEAASAHFGPGGGLPLTALAIATVF
jgi:hypothetical protein